MLLNHKNTVKKTNDYFLPFVKAAKGQNWDFIIDEVGSALGSSDAGKDYHLSASLGSAIWTVDWMLHAMSIVSCTALTYTDVG